MSERQSERDQQLAAEAQAKARAEQERKRRGAGGGGPPAGGSPPPGKDGKGDASSPRNWIVGIGAAALIAVVTFQFLAGGGGGDHLTQAEIDSRAAEFSMAGTIALPQVPQAERDQAIAAMQLPEQQAETLTAQVESGQTRLVYLTLWDTHAEDGDKVVVTSDGFSQQVNLLHAHQTVAIPEPAGGIVNVQGLDDGGGGITIGLMSGSAPVNLPYLSPGQQVGIPVVAGI